MRVTPCPWLFSGKCPPPLRFAVEAVGTTLTAFTARHDLVLPMKSPEDSIVSAPYSVTAPMPVASGLTDFPLRRLRRLTMPGAMTPMRVERRPRITRADTLNRFTRLGRKLTIRNLRSQRIESALWEEWM